MQAIWLLLPVLTTLPDEAEVVATITVKGMKSPDTCPAAVERRLSGTAGLASLKLLDFKAGLFLLTFKAGAAIDPDGLRKAVEPHYELARIEATLSGEIAIDEEKLYLIASSGAKCHLNGRCDEKPDGPSAKVCAEVEAKLRAWLAAKKTSVRITGELAESCCDGEHLLSTLKAELVPAK